MGRSVRRLLPAAIVIAALAMLLAPATPARAAGSVTVDRVDDPAPGTASACTAAASDCSLRGAVTFANAHAGTTINLPAATYSLTIAGTGETLAGDNNIGDLDVTASGTSIVGAGAGTTTILKNSSASYRLLEVNPAGASGFSFSISGVTLTGGATGDAGGAMACGGPTSITNVTDAVFSNNFAGMPSPSGGAVADLGGGTLNVTRTTFQGNYAQGDGGAIYMDAGGGGTLLVDQSTFLSNVGNGNSNGGAVYVAGSGNGNSAITRSAFLMNKVSGVDGLAGAIAVAANGGTLPVQYDRLVGNTAATSTNGNAVRDSNPDATGAAASADDDWWGVNTGPPANALSALTATRWLQLGHTASPGSILVNGTSTLTASLRGRNSGGPVAAGNLSGLPVSAAFSNVQLGTLSSTNPAFVDGLVAKGFTAGSVPGNTGGADVTVDNQTVRAPVLVQKVATLTYPLNGASAVDTAKPFTWTPIGNALNYYLMIGTSQGASDVLNSGTLPASQTTYNVPALPTGQTLWARIWTKGSDGVSRFNDVSFTASLRPATFTYPVNGAQNIDTRTPFAWTGASPGTQNYYLMIGTSKGASDIVNSGNLPASQTTYNVPALPTGQTLWARIWTKGSDGVNRFSDVSFTASMRPATFTNPVNGATGVTAPLYFKWNGASPGTQGYYLMIGTSQGASDVVSSGNLPPNQNNYYVNSLPPASLLWARIWTRGSDGVDRFSDISFRTA